MQESLGTPVILIEAHRSDANRSTGIVRLNHIAIARVHSNVVDGAGIAGIVRVEEQIAELQIRAINRAAMAGEVCLGIGITGNSDAMGIVQGVRETRAVKGIARRTTPEIRTAEEQLGRPDEILAGGIGDMLDRVVDADIEDADVRRSTPRHSDLDSLAEHPDHGETRVVGDVDELLRQPDIAVESGIGDLVDSREGLGGLQGAEAVVEADLHRWDPARVAVGVLGRGLSGHGDLVPAVLVAEDLDRGAVQGLRLRATRVGEIAEIIQRHGVQPLLDADGIGERRPIDGAWLAGVRPDGGDGDVDIGNGRGRSWRGSCPCKSEEGERCKEVQFHPGCRESRREPGHHPGPAWCLFYSCVYAAWLLQSRSTQ